MPIHLDSDEIIGRLKAVLEPLCAAYVSVIQQYLENVQAQKLFITPAAQPRVSRVPHDDKVYHIIVRFASPVSKPAGNTTGRLRRIFAHAIPTDQPNKIVRFVY